MASRTPLLALLLCSVVVVAGCIKQDGPAATGDGPGDVTSNATCADGCDKLVAFEETNKTEEGVDGVDHGHDYWAGRERVAIFEKPAQMYPFATYNAAGYEAEATFALDDPTAQDRMVYEGTASVEFTISNPQRHLCEGQVTFGGYFVCTDNLDKHGAPANAPLVPDPNPPSGLKLRYKHASTTEWIDAGDIGWGAPASIKITHPTQTDMPHSTFSAWAFQVVSPNTYDSTLVFDAKAEIVRVEGEIPLWPGHPNFYADTTWRKILDVDTVACDTEGCVLPGAEEAGFEKAQKLVSYGTRTLYVWINITEVTNPNPVLGVDNWFLHHINSSGKSNVTNVFDKENHGVDKKEHLWVLPVDDNGMDSPYADGSKWEFQLGGAFYKEGISCYGGCAQWMAKYHLTVIATNIELPLEEYDMSCLRDDYCPEPENATGQANAVRLLDVETPSEAAGQAWAMRVE